MGKQAGDYRRVGPECWDQLMRLYGGGPAIYVDGPPVEDLSRRVFVLRCFSFSFSFSFYFSFFFCFCFCLSFSFSFFRVVLTLVLALRAGGQICPRL